MKKITKFAVAALMTLGLFSCGGGNGGGGQSGSGNIQVAEGDLAKVNAALNNLNVPSTASQDFTLVTKGAGNVDIAWTSDNNAIAIEGNTAKVTPGKEDVTVKLTATATYNNASNTRDFNVTVEKLQLDVETITIREALAAAVGTEVTVQGVVVQLVCSNSAYTTPGGFYIADGDYAVYVYGANTAKAVQLGDEVIIKGNTAAYPTTLTTTTQIATPTLVATIAHNVDIKKMQWDTSKLEKMTVEEVATTPSDDTSLPAKVVYMENIRLNKYVTTYTSMYIYDWKDNPAYSTDPKILLYSGQGDAGMPEYDHLKDYLDKKINVVFAINGTSSKGKWRGCIMAVWLAE